MQIFLCLVVLLAVGCHSETPHLLKIPPPPTLALRPIADQPPEDVLINPRIRPKFFFVQCGQFWSSWGKWSACSATCGCGIQTRKRKCLKVSQPCFFGPQRPQFPQLPQARQPDANTTANAPAVRTLIKPQPPPIIPPFFWDPPGCLEHGHKLGHKHGPEPGHESDCQQRKCNLKKCCPPVNGQWNNWGCWSHCRAGVQRRQRSCDYCIPQGSGKPCSGNHFQDRCCSGFLDVVFAIDGSGSIDFGDFQQITSAVNNVILSMLLDQGFGPPETFRAGVQVFASSPVVHRYLNDFFTLPPSYPYPGTGTNIGAALNQVNNFMFNPFNGDRPNPPNPNVLVIISDGFGSGINPSLLSNIDRVIVVGVGPNVNKDIGDLATFPGDFFVTNSVCFIKPFLLNKLLCQNLKFPHQDQCRRYLATRNVASMNNTSGG